MRPFGAILLVAAMSVVIPATAIADCISAHIESISDMGDKIVLQSGQVYQVALFDRTTVIPWNPGEEVLVCNGDKIVNKDENLETVRVQPLQ